MVVPQIVNLLCVGSTPTLRVLKYFLLFFLFIGCSKANKKYIVVSSFDEVVFETNNKDKAHEAAQELTSFGRVFLSKPCYFVIEK
jgi:hypothetical protein